MSYSSCSCFVCSTGPYKFVYLVLENKKFGSLSTILSYWPLDVQHGKELSEDLRIRIVALHRDGRGYKKISYNLKLSYSTVARVIQRFSKTGFTWNRPRKCRSKKLGPCAVRQVQKLASKNRRMSAASIALEQWSQTQFLEGHNSAEFSSNQLQITPAWKFLMILKTLIIWIRCVWLGIQGCIRHILNYTEYNQ